MKFQKKYKWHDREKHFRDVNFIVRHIHPMILDLESCFLAHNVMNDAKAKGIQGFISLQTPQGELSVIDKTGIEASPLIDLL